MIVFAVIPMVLCTVFMFQLQQEDLGTWHIVAAYAEFAVIGCLAIVYFAITVLGPLAGSNPNPKTMGKMAIPAKIATKVSAKETM